MIILCLVCCLSCMFFIFSQVHEFIIHKNKEGLPLLLSLSLWDCHIHFLSPWAQKTWLLEWGEGPNGKKEKNLKKISFILLYYHNIYFQLKIILDI